MEYLLSELASVTGGQLIDKEKEYPFDFIAFDSREILFPRRSVFLTFQGNRKNGHDYIREIYQKGGRNFIISKNIDMSAFPQAQFLIVDNIVKALQRWAVYHRSRFNIPVIGITGSNGKTIVKEWLSEILSANKVIIKSPKSYNSQIGVPLSVLNLDSRHEIGIFEAGISKTNEMINSSLVINCSLGIFTNIGDAHSAGFKSIEEKIDEKLQLFNRVKNLIYCADHLLVHKAVQNTFSPVKLLNWSWKDRSDCAFQLIKEQNQQVTKLNILQGQKEYNFITRFSDNASIENLIHCIIASLHLGLSQENIQSRINSLQRIPMRSEIVQGIHQNLIINDSYNFDLHSLSSGLKLLGRVAGGKEKVLIISDIFEHNPGDTYGHISRLINQHKLQMVFSVGEAVQSIHSTIYEPTLVMHFESTVVLKEYLRNNPLYDKAILVKGARDFQFENIIRSLFDKKHLTVLEIDLNALDHNISEYSRFLNKDTRLMAMVKASAYGSGSYRLVRKLENLHVDYLAVAYIDEGIFLRKSGITLPILVLNPDPHELDSLIRFQLEPEIYSLHQLESYLKDLNQFNEPLRVHLKLDTGMHRLGFENNELQKLIDLINTNPVSVKSVFSHLSSAENPKKDKATYAQINLFLKMYQIISEAIGYRPIRHILNSSGIIRFSDYQFEMVRLGIGMYGIDMTDILQDQLRKVHRLKSWISQIKSIGKGESVGYGRSFVLNEETNIATIGIGYADGLPVYAGNGNASFFINGHHFSTIGNICMDMAMLDLGKNKDIRMDHEVEIFGNHIDIKKLAIQLNTIPYDLLCRISGRVKRIYTEE